MARKRKPKFHASRAARAEKALNAYQLALGESGPHDAGRIRDLLQDMLHWLAAQPKPNDYPEPTETLRESCGDACCDFPKELEEDDVLPAP